MIHGSEATEVTKGQMPPPQKKGAGKKATFMALQATTSKAAPQEPERKLEMVKETRRNDNGLLTGKAKK